MPRKKNMNLPPYFPASEDEDQSVKLDENATGSADEYEPSSQDWAITPAVKKDEDPLLNCLAILSRIYERPQSLEALRAGLPIGKDGMTPALFMRAAERIGLTARLLKRPLHRISQHTLPCVLLYKDKRAVILTGYDRASGQYKVIYPETGGESKLDKHTLENRVSGYVFFVKPRYDFARGGQSEHSGMLPSAKDWLWDTLKQFKSIYYQVIVAALFINLFMLTAPLFIMNVYDRVIPNQAFDSLWVLALGAGIVFLFDFLLRSLRAYFLDIASRGVDTILSARLFEKLMSLNYAKKPASAGVLAGNMREFESIRDFFTSTTIATLVDVPFVVIFLLAIYYVGGSVVMVPLLALPLVYLAGRMLQKPVEKLIRKSFHGAAQKAALLVEALNGLEAIKLFRGESYLQRRWEAFTGAHTEARTRAGTLTALSVNLSALISNLVTIAVVVYGVYLINDGDMSIGGLIAAVILSSRVMAPTVQLSSLLTRLQHAREAYAALSEFMQTPSEKEAGKRFLHRPVLGGRIQFDKVTFAYPAQTQDALRDVSFTIEPGEKVGIIGPVGSGKSTLAKLLTHLYEPDKGSVSVDGTDVRQIEPADLRRNIGVVPQDVQLFNGSVRENITFGAAELDDAQILRAAAIGGVTDFLGNDKQGLDRMIGERGEALSGGQRQGVAIARAFAFDPNLLVLDEPSASLDPGSENRLLGRLKRTGDGKTMLLITHRTPLLNLTDRILVFSHGKIVADGKREKILKDLKDGKIKA